MGNRIMEEEIKPDGTRNVEKVYEYTVENRLKAVSDKEDLLTAYSYGDQRLTNERFTEWTGYYTYDPRGSVTGVTDSKGMIWQSYRYDAFGSPTFGQPQYNNVYTYNAESYNPNVDAQYLRARYYSSTTADFISEDSYLGDITDSLSLNRYNYVKSSPLNYVDPSGHINVPAMIGGAIIGAIGGAGSSFIMQLIFNNGDISYRDLAGDAIGGAIIGGAEGAFAGARIPEWIKNFVKIGDRLSTLLTYVVKEIINGRVPDIKDMFAQFVFGEVAGKFIKKIGGRGKCPQKGDRNCRIYKCVEKQ